MPRRGIGIPRSRGYEWRWRERRLLMNQPVRTSLYEASRLRDLTELLRQIHARETALPDFQRDFVWDTTMTQDLIVSIAYNHAAGSVWLIRNTQRVFVWRKIEGAPPLESHQPTF